MLGPRKKPTYDKNLIEFKKLISFRTTKIEPILNDKNFHAFTCQPGDDQVDMEDEDALLAGLEMPILSLQKPSIFNIKADQQVTVMEDFDEELPEPMPTF